jgi:hypothetical protein
MNEPFTPAPWRWHTSNSWKRLKRDDHGICMNVLEPFVHWRDQHPDCTVSEADMALIAAAPELYAALRAVCDGIEGRPDMRALLGFTEHSWLNVARAALAKARGEQ